MSHIDDAVGNTAHSQLEDLALKHSSFADFMQDMERLAERAWHNAKSHSEGQQSLGDEEPADEPQNSDDSEDRGPNQPVQPASPQSESGFPTSNVESHPV